MRTLLALAFLAAGCGGGKHGPGPDVTPPGTISDLTVAASSESTITLAWTAPGDDGDRGTAARYDLRYTLDDPPPAWAIATPIGDLPPPGPAGQPERFTLTGLPIRQVYYFALRAEDAAGNRSEFSNAVRAQTGDPAPPAQVTDLAARNLLPHGLTLAFTAPGDDGMEGRAVRYGFRRSPDPITEATWGKAESLAVSLSPGPGGSPESLRVVNLEPGTSYHFAVRAWDDAGKAGPVSNDREVTLPPDTVAPARVADLAVAMEVPYRARLTWTAPGNDGEESRATGYEIRWAEGPVTEAAWDTARVVGIPPVPREPGEGESFEVHSLPAGRAVWFGVRAVDEAGNRGPVSNEGTGVVMGPRRTWRVTADGTGDAPTVQAAMDSALAGDVILVGPGRYTENLDFLGKDLTVKSVEGPEVTILDGSGKADAVVVFVHHETRASVLEGFTITGGTGSRIHGPSPYGGGIYTYLDAPTIRGNWIVGNTAYVGGGMAVDTKTTQYPDESPLVQDNLFENNESSFGGGMSVVWGNVEIRGNVFWNNRCSYDGGAIFAWMRDGAPVIEGNEFWENHADDHGGAVMMANRGNPGPVTLSGNLFVRNEAWGAGTGDTGSGGALDMWRFSGRISHNTIVGNQGWGETPCSGGGICLYETPSDLVIEFNILAYNEEGGIVCDGQYAGATRVSNLYWDNVRGDFGCFPPYCPGMWGEGESHANPLFCDPTNDDYRLAADSPAITPGGVMGAFSEPGCGPSGQTSPNAWRPLGTRHEE